MPMKVHRMRESTRHGYLDSAVTRKGVDGSIREKVCRRGAAQNLKEYRSRRVDPRVVIDAVYTRLSVVNDVKVEGVVNTAYDRVTGRSRVKEGSQISFIQGDSFRVPSGGGFLICGTGIAQDRRVDTVVKTSRAYRGVRTDPIVIDILSSVEDERVPLTSVNLETCIEGERY